MPASIRSVRGGPGVLGGVGSSITETTDAAGAVAVQWDPAGVAGNATIDVSFPATGPGVGASVTLDRSAIVVSGALLFDAVNHAWIQDDVKKFFNIVEDTEQKLDVNVSGVVPGEHQAFSVSAGGSWEWLMHWPGTFEVGQFVPAGAPPNTPPTIVKCGPYHDDETGSVTSGTLRIDGDQAGLTVNISGAESWGGQIVNPAAVNGDPSSWFCVPDGGSASFTRTLSFGGTVTWHNGHPTIVFTQTGFWPDPTGQTGGTLTLTGTIS